jgi:Na+/proline symporter
MTIEYTTLGLYFVVLLVMGYSFSKLTLNMSDFVRGGARGTWWLVGSSMVMGGISAFTFTGNASAAFDAGPTFLIIYVANCVAYLIGWLFLAAWLRQSRAYTHADLLRARFGTAVEQFSAYSSVLLAPVGSAIQLWALATFSSAVFGFSLLTTIVVIGIVVVAYSTFGGRWAVMATDFVQGVVMMVITVLVAVLTYVKIGGLSEFLGYFSDPRFAEDFQLVKEPGQFSSDRFTMKWIIVVFFMTIYHQVSLVTASRYLTVKDGREARRASLFAFFLMAFGSVVWFFPAMAARFLYGDEILAQGLDAPSESAYAYIAMQLLPNGLLGVLIAAMFSATMSSMDSGLNVQVGIIVRNIVPRLRSAFGRSDELSDRAQMAICYASTLVLGILIIGIAILFSMQQEIILFDAYLLIASVIGIPLAFPLLVGLWIKRIPSWSFFVIFGACLLPSLLSVYDAQVNESPWTLQDRALWIFIAGFAATLLCIPFYRMASGSEKTRIDTFYKNIRTPVDFAKEIGQANDWVQARLIGRSTLVVGAGISLLLVLPNDGLARLCIFGVAAAVAAIGALLILASRHREKVAAEEAGDSS